jgi:regulator of RNase E activity RraA
MTTTIPPIAAFDRCEPDLLARLARFGTSMVSDAMERFGALDSEIQPQWPTARLVGSAFTVWTRSGDNLAIHEALDVVGPGDVLVVNGSGDKSRALIGEMIGIKAKARGVAGFVLDGAARDIEALQDLDMPVFARACTLPAPTSMARSASCSRSPLGAFVFRPATPSSPTVTVSPSSTAWPWPKPSTRQQESRSRRG